MDSLESLNRSFNKKCALFWYLYLKANVNNCGFGFCNCSTTALSETQVQRLEVISLVYRPGFLIPQAQWSSTHSWGCWGKAQESQVTRWCQSDVSDCLHRELQCKTNKRAEYQVIVVAQLYEIQNCNRLDVPRLINKRNRQVWTGSKAFPDIKKEEHVNINCAS